jgi:hypothetical protein
MKVSEHIRKVPRPINTIVENNGKPGPNQYAVRERAGIIYVSVGNPKPKNGHVIGHIIDNKYIPLHDIQEFAKPDSLSYGSAALVRSVSKNLVDDLLAVYPCRYIRIMSVASLRVIRPSISNYLISQQYKKSFVSVFYPGVSVSPNSVSNLLENLGMDGEKRKAFFKRRIAAISKEHHIAIDGTLKQDTSTVNDLSNFSYKGRVKRYKEISVLYAYDLERMEPVCADVFPGNSIDASSYPSFIRDNDIKDGIIVADKGFPHARIKEELSARPSLHFLTPMNDVRIANNGMLDIEGVLTGIEKQVLYKKAAIKGGHYLYAFKDTGKYAAEETTFLSRAKLMITLTRPSMNTRRKHFI